MSAIAALLCRRTTQLTCPAGAGSVEAEKTYVPAGSGAALGSACLLVFSRRLAHRPAPVLPLGTDDPEPLMLRRGSLLLDGADHVPQDALEQGGLRGRLRGAGGGHPREPTRAADHPWLV